MRAWDQLRAGMRRCVVPCARALARLTRRHRSGSGVHVGLPLAPIIARPLRQLREQADGWVNEWRGARARMHAAMRARRRAHRRALTLLLNLLDPTQRRDFRLHGHFDVIGGSTGERYRVRTAMFANIDVMDPNGVVTHRICAQPSGELPVYDFMAGQLLYLQGAETERRFLLLANIHEIGPDGYLRSRHPP